jgi:hypothetical protein
MSEPRWMTPQEVAVMAGFSDSFIRAEIKAGELPAVLVRSQSKPRQRGRWRIARADAVAYVQRLGVQHHTQRT